jgi:subtilisin family serine protease
MTLMGLDRRTPTSVCLALLAAVAAGPPPAAADGGEPVVVRVPASSRAALASLGLAPRTGLDYSSFQWLELTAGDYDRLRDGGVPHTLVPGARELRFMGFAFDPVAGGEPALAAAMTADPARPGFRLVQFDGPVRAEWLAAVEAAGARPLQYYPNNAYLVWARPDHLDAAAALPFVRWQGLFHPGYKVAANLEGRTGRIANVDVLFYDDGDVRATLDAIEALGGEVVQVYAAQPDKAFYDAIVRLDAAAVAEVAKIPTVWWLGHQSPEPILDDEMSSQIVAGNHPGGVPVTGYFAHLASLGFDGSGVTWATIDTGVDYDHPDLGPRIVGGYSFPGIPVGCDLGGTPGADCTGGGHGTHVAGIIGGDATAGFTDASGFLYGLGVAPGHGIFAMNSLSAPTPWPPLGGWQEHSKRAVLGGAIGGNNSWTTGEGTQHGYQASERTHDLMVRDGDFDTTDVAEPFIEVFSAGNSGGAGLTAPKEAKNLIVTANSLNFRAGNIDLISGSSSRGPAVDGRWVPTIAAPGTTIASARNDLGGLCATPIAGTNDLYAFCSGTSMASPHAAGTVVLATEWWRSFNAGADPSPAMARALLVNAAVDMGTPDVPNIHEGWGRINTTNVIAPGVERQVVDQSVLFAGTGDQLQVTVAVDDPGQPLKVTLAWSDAPGAVGANPALVNDLDLTVDTGGGVYLGNVFTAGWSATGGSADARNNLENVFVQNPGPIAVITIDAVNVAGDGVPYNGDLTDQDFALVCTNCVEPIFFDGFESGDVSAWSFSSGGP